MFKLEVVKNCAVCPELRGEVRMATEIIAAISGTVHAEKSNEWALFLIGSTAENGRVIEVTGFEVPKNQSRSSGRVVLPSHEIPDNCVMVLHSHHGMGAFWSQEDETEFNTRYPASIVITHDLTGGRQYSEAQKESFKVLGFGYLAIGNVTLGCGAVARIEFDVVPLGLEDEWPWRTPAKAFDQAVTELQAKGPIAKVGDCSLKAVTQGTKGRWFTQTATKCGLREKDERPIVQAFGYKEGTEILKDLPKPGLIATDTSKELRPWDSPNVVPTRHSAQLQKPFDERVKEFAQKKEAPTKKLTKQEKRRAKILDSKGWKGDIRWDYDEINDSIDARVYVATFPLEAAECVLDVAMDLQSKDDKLESQTEVDLAIDRDTTAFDAEAALLEFFESKRRLEAERLERTHDKPKDPRALRVL